MLYGNYTINSNYFKIVINLMLYIGETIPVNWDAGKWSHTGHFPIQWLSENKYLEKELPTTVSYSFKRQFNHYCSLSC